MPSSPSPPTDLDPSALAAKRGARLALGAFTILSTAFVVSSTWQLCRAALFENDPSSGRRGSAGLDPTSACALGLGRLSSSVEAALVVASRERSEDAAVGAYRAATAPAWARSGSTKSACESEPRGTDALATLARLRLAGEVAVRHGARDLAPVRKEVAAVVSRGAGGDGLE